MALPNAPPNSPPKYDQQAEDRKYMRLALNEAHKSPPKPTNFRVGACLVSHQPSTSPTNTLLVTGYTLECEGNTHAEQCCFLKIVSLHSCHEEEIGWYLPDHPEQVWLYTTMEPCNKRSVGNLACVDRILALKRMDGRQAIEKVLVGVAEPETFVGVNQGRKRLEGAGIEVVVVPGMEEEILAVATAGHEEG
jgi:pyrimidine deaminase RibD-like protein